MRRVVAYGEHRGQRASVRVPAGEGTPGRLPLVVLVHGGSWRWPYGRFLMWWLARDVVARGWIAMNVSYRRTGRFGGGGGWPMTFDDVVAAVQCGTTLEHEGQPIVDPDRVVVVGHSAGGHLALWAAASGRVTVGAVVSLAGPPDLRAIVDRSSGDSVVEPLIAGAPSDRRFELTSPIEMLPIGVPISLIHGADDTIVPLGDVERFAGAVRASGGDVELTIIVGEGHRSALSPRSKIWARAVHDLSGWFDAADASDLPR